MRLQREREEPSHLAVRPHLRARLEEEAIEVPQSFWAVDEAAVVFHSGGVDRARPRIDEAARAVEALLEVPEQILPAGAQVQLGCFLRARVADVRQEVPVRAVWHRGKERVDVGGAYGADSDAVTRYTRERVVGELRRDTG